MKNRSDIKWLINQLRKVSLKWRGRGECLRNTPRKEKVVGKYKNGNPKKLVYYQCNSCNGWFRTHEIEIDHIFEVGKFKDWDSYVARLFCEPDNLQVLCVSCHTKKTSRMNRLVDKLVRDRIEL